MDDKDDYEPSPESARAHWRETLRRPQIAAKLNDLAMRFPCLRGAPIMPFDMDALWAWGIEVDRQYWALPLEAKLHGSRWHGARVLAVLFFARICGHYFDTKTLPDLSTMRGSFDVYQAVSYWNAEDREAFTAWVREGYLPAEHALKLDEAELSLTKPS